MNRDQWIAAERIRAISDAENFLTGFCRTWPTLPCDDLPALVKHAMGSLVIVNLTDPVRGQVRMKEVAKAAELTLTAIRKQIMERVWFFNNLNRLMDSRKTRTEAEQTLTEIMSL